MPNENAPQSRRIEVFRAGTFTAMDGARYTFSEGDVGAIAAAYDAQGAPAPVVVGHPTHDDPAFGWASGFEVEDGKLIAEIGDLAPAFVSAVESGRYRKVSMKFYAPDASNNPVPGTYYPRHIGFLGGAAPAVSGLKPVEFAGPDEGTVEIALAAGEIAFGTEYGFKDTAKVFRSIREWIIDKFGIEDADKAVDAWYVDWIDDAADKPDEAATPGFAAPSGPARATAPAKRPVFTAPAPVPASNEEDPMAKTMDDRERRLAEREAALARTEGAAFADELQEAGHLPAEQRDRLVAFYAALPAEDADVSFAEGGETRTIPPRAMFRELMGSVTEALPKGSAVPPETPDAGRAPSFAAPDNAAVDPEDLAHHARAVAFQSANPGVSFIDAAIATQEG